ncbi:hypothetical protein IU433_02475 [Nocardia puris]|uniref:Uncharacterized protein n=1 Tax=Nocardia puris TaxID=208602 RepID=A0A366DVH3_9NOCA|nr:hypothetical protein [Nocardia puris]MBF6210651.1 hypothetical protein [Nocardia puris]MBF6369377.1 hypothetical protein [Nocardia puris]MBF6457912.1 hypothetical protein [Nocardia puris]RBO94082.1 hypothetical protein DFR74_102502 [Nocardia puris]
MDGVQDVLAGVGIALTVFAAVAFVLAVSWRWRNPTVGGVRLDRILIDLGIGLAAVGIVASVAGLVPVRSPGGDDAGARCGAATTQAQQSAGECAWAGGGSTR